MKTISDQWDDAAESWSEFVRTNKDHYRDEMNNPAMFKMLCDIKGKKVLDLGCGEGYNTRLLTQKDADVTGVDISEKMIELAVVEEEREAVGIDYHVSDATDLQMLKDNAFDIVTCFMALHDIEDHIGAIKEVSRVLRSKGRFVFSIPHPCFEVRMIDDKVVCGWVSLRDGDGSPMEISIFSKADDTPHHFAVDRYFDRSPEKVEWKLERLTKHFKTTSFHRTLTDYVSALSDAGLMISRIDEPRPSDKGIKIHPVMKEVNRIPHSIIIETVEK